MRIKLFIILLILVISKAEADEHTLRVGIRPAYPPYEFTSNERIIGFNIDILHQLSDLFSFEFEYVEAQKPALAKMLDSGEIDLISFCFQSEANKKRFNLSLPYNMVTYGIYIPYESSIQKPQDIMPYRVSVQNDLLYKMIKNNKNFGGKLLLRQTQQRCIEDLIQGDAEAAIIASLSGKYFIEKNSYKGVKVPPINFKNLQYSFAFNKQNDSLLVQFNEGLNILRETGTYNQTYQKWFGEVHPKQIEAGQEIIYWPYYVTGTITLLLLLLFIKQRKSYLNLKNLKEKEVQIRYDAEKSLFEYQQIVDQIVDKLSHIIIVIDQNKQFKFVNDTFAAFCGCQKAEILKNEMNQAILDEYNIYHQLITQLPQEDYSKRKLTVADQEGTYHTFEVDKTKIQNPGKNDIVYLITGFDVTHRLKYEQLLKEEKALLTSLVNSIPDPIFYKNKQLQYIGGNNAFKELNGFVSNDEFVDKTDFELYEQSTATKYHKTDKQILDSKKPVNFNRWETTKKGDKVLYDTLKVPIIDSNGALEGIVGVSRDVTKQAEVQQELEKAKNKAEESDKLKTTFLTNLSHEIRTPLNSIIGFSDLVTDPDLTDDQREEFTELISKSGTSLLNLVDDIIDLSKIEADQVQINKSKFDVNRMLIDLHEAIEDSRDIVHRHAVRLEYFIPGNEEEARYYENDDFRIRQILTNLIKNALKYTNKGEVKFGYRFSENEIIFFVRDTGLGIPKDQKESVFEQYNQSDSVEKFGGSGLGLSISKKLVELLGGKIDFTTDEMQGSEFYFSFPYQKDPDEEKANPNTQLAEEYDWNDKQILVAEDEQNNYMFIEEALRSTGVKLIWATDGQEAVDMVKENPDINLILMDIKMPNLDGYQATKLIKKMRNDVPVIAQTAYAMSDERDLSLQAGCDEYLTKPIRPKKLLRKINQLL